MSDNTNLQHELRSLRAELAAMRSEHAKSQAIRSAVATRGAADPVAVEAVVSSLIRPNASGDLVAVDKAGKFRFGQGRGAYMPLDELLDEMAKNNPDLFKSSPQSIGEGKDEIARNPFVKGANYSVTEQMLLYRNDPERAEYLEYQASLGRNNQ